MRLRVVWFKCIPTIQVGGNVSHFPRKMCKQSVLKCFIFSLQLTFCKHGSRNFVVSKQNPPFLPSSLPYFFFLTVEITYFFLSSHDSLQATDVTRDWVNWVNSRVSFLPFHAVFKVSFNAWCVCRDLWVSQRQHGLPGCLWPQRQSAVWGSDLRANQYFDWGKAPVEDTDECCCVCVFVPSRILMLKLLTEQDVDCDWLITCSAFLGVFRHTIICKDVWNIMMSVLSWFVLMFDSLQICKVAAIVLVTKFY